MLRSMKKSGITFDEAHYICLSETFYRRCWITEKHIIPAFYKNSERFTLFVDECPNCKTSHDLSQEHFEVISQYAPTFIGKMKRIARLAENECNLRIFGDISIKEFNEEYCELYDQVVRRYTHDTTWGKILYFPHAI